MTKTEIAKKVIHIIVTVGVGKIVGDVIKSNTNPESVTDKVTYTAGSYALGGLVAAETVKYADNKINEITAHWTKKDTEVIEN